MNKQYNPKNMYFPERITAAMSGIFDYPLTIIEAPMGYGKTTAVRECMKNSGANLQWQRVYDSSIHSFWIGFCNMFDEFYIECSKSLVQLGFPNDSVSRQEALNIIELIKFPMKTVLVIDDYHMALHTEINDFIEYLILNEIPNLSIVLTGRYISLQNLDELKLKGYLKHIIQEIFEFDAKEIKNYYKICGINLKDCEVDKLYSLTEGWVSALYLMMLNYINEGDFTSTSNIYKLVEKTLYMPFSDEIKEFLQIMCLFDSFKLEQAIYMWENENADRLLAEITSKNTLIKYDEKTKTYQMHNIFTKLLKDIFESRHTNHKKLIYEKAAHWYMNSGDYFTAIQYFYRIEDFDSLMSALEIDKGHCIYSDERKEIFIQYYVECPKQIKVRHPIALLIYSINLFLYNEFELFKKVSNEFSLCIHNNGCVDDEDFNMLSGEFELLLCITGYNDITKMLEHIQKASALLKQPAKFIDTKEGWTFGSSSVLYMFYREAGKLESEVRNLTEALPFYSQITNGHGKGGEHVMEAEWYFNRGDFENAEIIIHKALYEANRCGQYDIIICTQFLQARIALLKGDYAYILHIYQKLHEEMSQNKQYNLLHCIDLCDAFINAGLRRNQKIPCWIEKGDFESSRLFFPAMAFMNIVYGRVLLINGEYYKLLGIAEKFMGIASVFPNLLGQIYTNIYIASANEQIFRRENALSALMCALDIAMPDKVYMPFVENGDYIKPLLEELNQKGLYRKDIACILTLYEPYRKAIEQINSELSVEDKPTLTKREIEIAQLAAKGFSNKEIGEKLFISQNTVKTMLKRVFEKLNINSRAVLKQYIDEKIL